MEIGQKIQITNKAIKTRLHPYPYGYEHDFDDELNWTQFPDISEMIDHYMAVGIWPLNEVDILTYYEKYEIGKTEVVLIGIRHLSVGVTGNIVIIQDDLDYSYTHMIGYRKFIPIISQEFWLVVDSLYNRPYLTFPSIEGKRYIFNPEPYKKYMIEDNVGVQTLCPIHDGHRRIWNTHTKSYVCDLCNAPLPINFQSQLPF